MRYSKDGRKYFCPHCYRWILIGKMDKHSIIHKVRRK